MNVAGCPDSRAHRRHHRVAPAHRIPPRAIRRLAAAALHQGQGPASTVHRRIRHSLVGLLHRAPGHPRTSQRRTGHGHRSTSAEVLPRWLLIAGFRGHLRVRCCGRRHISWRGSGPRHTYRLLRWIGIAGSVDRVRHRNGRGAASGSRYPHAAHQGDRRRRPSPRLARRTDHHRDRGQHPRLRRSQGATPNRRVSGGYSTTRPGTSRYPTATVASIGVAERPRTITRYVPGTADRSIRDENRYNCFEYGS